MPGERGSLKPMSRKIAVVEDEAELASLIEYNLTRGGFDVKVLNGAEQTLGELETWQPDLIVLDVMLPGQDGFDLCRQIRQTGKLARTPVVFLTARSDEVDRVLGIDNVKVIHANDSKTPLGSHIDRHEHIGHGYIGEEGFRRILNHP